MKVTQHNIKIRDLIEGYVNDAEDGVVAYSSQLDIRPKYQREFVYNDNQRDEVVRTVMRKLPLNVMYWVDRGEQVAQNNIPRYEILDGQQRTLSVCEYAEGSFSVDGAYFHNLPEDKREDFLNYELFIYVCSGTDSEKLEWFKIINIAGEKLTDQELRNAVYAGSWVTDAKKYFSKSKCAAYNTARDYLKGTCNRQDYLETAIAWAAAAEGESIEEYMARHQQDPTAQPLWSYFSSVIDWAQAIFPIYRKEMKGVPWGLLYNKYHERRDLNPAALEERIRALMEDPDVTKKSGIYDFVLSGNERALSVRQFDARLRREAYERQSGICPLCGNHYAIDDMQADHIIPWSRGGHTTSDNCQMLCSRCNGTKSNK